MNLGHRKCCYCEP